MSVETFCSLPVATGSIEAVWLLLMGISGPAGTYFLQRSGDDLGAWLLTEGDSGAVFTPSAGMELPRVSATLTGGLPADIVVNRS